MARGLWQDLSPEYRARLERGGMTAQSHAAGVPLDRARGHASRETRAAYISRIYAAKEAAYGTRQKWDPRAALRRIEYTPGGRRRTAKELRRIAGQLGKLARTPAMTVADLDEETREALYYHGVY